MRSVIWMITSEFRQSRLHFILIFCISFLLGISASLSIQAANKITQLANNDVWDADLVILPKGVTLQDFKAEIFSGQTSAFLPEAMFDSTVLLGNGQFRAQAILPLKSNAKSEVMLKGDQSFSALSSFKNQIKIVPWHDQAIYYTPEWKNKLIAGFFAKGSFIIMKNLKELIDRKTVGQAIFIQQQQEHDRQTQNQLKKSLFIYETTLSILFLLSFLSLFLWLKIRIANSLNIFEEIGLPLSRRFQYITGLLGFSVLAPAILATILASAFLVIF